MPASSFLPGQRAPALCARPTKERFTHTPDEYTAKKSQNTWQNRRQEILFCCCCCLQLTKGLAAAEEEKKVKRKVFSLSLSPSVRMRSGRAAGKSLRLRFWCATKNCVTCNSGGISSYFALLSPDLNLKAKEGGEEITSRKAASCIAFGSS